MSTQSTKRRVANPPPKSVKWSVVSVNFNSLDYLDYQARVLEEFNDDYEFIICDNTFPRQQKELEELKSRHKNIKIYINPLEKWKHGSGLDTGISKSHGKYICMIDPDFFFHKKNYLQFLEGFLDQGYHAVGTQYIKPNEFFPMPWGAAYILDEIKDLSMDNGFMHCKECNKWICPGHLDTGYQIRVRLKNERFIAFKEVAHNIPYLGNHSIAFSPKCYEYNGEIICSHLMRGGYDKAEVINEEVKKIRKNYCEYFYSILR